jgi:hypothetical protein
MMAFVLWRVTLGVLLCLSLWATGPLIACSPQSTLAASASCGAQAAVTDASNPPGDAPVMRATVPDPGARAQLHALAPFAAPRHGADTAVYGDPPAPARALHARPHLRDIPLLI